MIAETFNEYFLSVAENRKEISKQNNINPRKFPKFTPNHYLSETFLNPFPNMKLNSISTKEVEKIIKSLKSKNSSGYDGVSTKVLKISSPFISSPLTYICNKPLHFKGPK
jgi:hypothetical protein